MSFQFSLRTDSVDGFFEVAHFFFSYDTIWLYKLFSSILQTKVIRLQSSIIIPSLSKKNIINAEISRGLK